MLLKHYSDRLAKNWIEKEQPASGNGNGNGNTANHVNFIKIQTSIQNQG
jgi:hypothetical protein